MIILLSSASYRLNREQLDGLVAAFSKKAGPGGAVEHVAVGPEMTAKDVWARVGTGSLFASKRLVIVRDALTSLRAAETKALAELLKKRDLPAGTTLVLVASEPLPAMTKNPLVSFCKKSKAVKKISVPVPEGPAAARELTARAKKIGAELSQPVANELLERAADFDQALSEVDKLALYALSQKSAQISSEDVQAMTNSSLEADIFELLRALSQGNRRQALQKLHEQLSSGAHPLYVLAMLRYQFRSLMLVAEATQAGGGMSSPAAIQQKTGLSPYVIRSMQQTLGRYSPKSIRAIFNKLVDADEAIKTSAIDGDVALDLLVLAMSA